MPHDARGRRVEVGDYVKVMPHNLTRRVVGPVACIYPGAKTCSGEVRWLGLGQLESSMFDAKDALLILKADGSEPEAGTDPAVLQEEAASA